MKQYNQNDYDSGSLLKTGSAMCNDIAFIPKEKIVGKAGGGKDIDSGFSGKRPRGLWCLMPLLLKTLKAGTTLIITGILIFGCVCQGYAENVILKSTLVWSTDNTGDYVVPGYAAGGTYECEDVVKTEGHIQAITASWEFKGRVTLELSVNNGKNYARVVNGVPLQLALGAQAALYEGKQIRWRVTLGAESELIKVKISYADTSGVIGDFGQPELSGFKFRKAVYITNPGDQGLFNYQVKIPVGEGQRRKSGRSGQEADVYCEGNVREDFQDIRFTCADGKTLITYYLEKIEEQTGTFWVKIPQLPVGVLRIYIYYGNSRAKNMSCAEDVFDFYAGFTDALDTSNWQVETEEAGSCAVSDGRLKLDSTEILSKEYEIKDGIIEYRAASENNADVQVILRKEQGSEVEDSAQVAHSSGYKGAEHCIAVGDIVKANQPESLTAGEGYDYRVILNSTDILFQRYTRGYKELEAEVNYNDENGLTAGRIGLKAGRSCINYFEWIRVRKYSAYNVAVNKKASLFAAPESVKMPVFKGVRLNPKGDLILQDSVEKGSYASQTIALADTARVIVPGWTKGEIVLDVSADGGLTYKTGCGNGMYYYASKKDFTAGSKLRFKLALISDVKSAPVSVEEVNIVYRQGAITLISPNGGESLSAGKQTKITWSAIEYEPDYKLKLEYSLNGGKSYKRIIKRTENDGVYVWNLPKREYQNVLVRVSDALDSKVFDVSDGGFSITKEEDSESKEEESPSAEDTKELQETKDVVEVEEIVQKEKSSGPRLYDLLIKLGDNRSADPEEDAACYKEGDIVMARPAGGKWSKTEREGFLIIQVYLSEEDARQITQPKQVATGSIDEFGHPVMKTVKKRATRINLEKLGLSKTGERKKNLKTIRALLENNPMDKEEMKDLGD